MTVVTFDIRSGRVSALVPLIYTGLGCFKAAVGADPLVGSKGFCCKEPLSRVLLARFLDLNTVQDLVVAPTQRGTETHSVFTHVSVALPISTCRTREGA